MKKIQVLDKNTIDKIAAGEVVERPSSVVKELVENAIDAGATAVAVEIKDGGTTLIRITDNGSGIEKEQVKTAFLRHATSKIERAEDLLAISSLGFRGEALSSIAAVSQVELITKTSTDFTGSRYRIEGGTEVGLEEIGAPDGTTFLIRNLFYNVPARKKFLKSHQTEAGYISDLMERLALSRPDISFKFINNNQTKLQTSGNTNLKDIIYHIYGRDITANLIPVNREINGVRLHGFIGKPLVSRGNRSFENYFVNGRYVKSNLISRAIEEGYKGFVMQHKYPFTVLHLTIDGKMLDVNVHPTKMELRISNQEDVYRFIYMAVSDALNGRELIPVVSFGTEEKSKEEHMLPKTPEPFEKNRIQKMQNHLTNQSSQNEKKNFSDINDNLKVSQNSIRENTNYSANDTMFDTNLLAPESCSRHKIIGQLFKTYWLVEFEDKLFIIDQHAAHEKVLYERNVKLWKEKKHSSQLISPPLILTLSHKEEEILCTYQSYFEELGFEISSFGGKEYSITAVPGNLYGLAEQELFIELIDSLDTMTGKLTPDMIRDKLATMSCKAAVKGNQNLTCREMEELISELMTLENPYNCPHGRPTIISMSKYELEKKFKRIV